MFGSRRPPSILPLFKEFTMHATINGILKFTSLDMSIFYLIFNRIEAHTVLKTVEL